METEQTYWIQEKAPAGNYVNSIGLPGRNYTEALEQLRSWQNADFNAKKTFRLTLEIVVPMVY